MLGALQALKDSVCIGVDGVAEVPAGGKIVLMSFLWGLAQCEL